jgi:hypothetical protein
MRSIVSSLLCFSALLLSSCGGGGGGGSTPPPPPPVVQQSQTIAFATPGEVIRPLTDAIYTNAASGGAGTGATAYLSSNTAVATVSGVGVVTFVAAGSVTITANKAADPNYLAATASYSLTITAPVVPQPQIIAFATAGAITRPLADGSYTNAAAGGAGTGAITYQSSNTGAATVSANGVVTFVAAGSTTITANKAADANYLAATASYSLTITAPVVAQPQTIAFAAAGVVTRSLIDGSFTSAAAGGAGTGAISYQSSNSAVATVSGAGVVIFVTAGTVTITANKAADANYLAATASYTLTISSAAAVTFAGWMGAQDTQVTFSAGAGNLEFLRSPQLDCNAANFAGCTGGVVSAVSTTPVDNVAYLGREVNWWLRRGTALSPALHINAQKFTPRLRHSAVSWRGKLWIIGGAFTNAGSVSDVWNSDDGEHWTQVSASASFPYRSPGTYVVFNDRLWMLGGMSGSAFSGVVWNDDVWSSGDGATWRREVEHAPWDGRSGHSSFVFNNRLWVIGGYPNYFAAADRTDDAWSSADGINWVEETDDAPFSQGAMATAMNGRIYVTGGSDGPPFRNDVWSSADGRAWRLENAAAPFPGRSDAVFTSLNNRLYLAAGQDEFQNGRANDVWSSADGISWVEEAHSAPFAARYFTASAVHNGRLWILGGDVAEPDDGFGWHRQFGGGDVWSTSNGSTWTEHSPHAGFFPGTHNTLVHQGRIWILGGWDGEPRNDTWNSTDGMNWTQLPPGTSFPPRRDSAVAVFNNQFWVSGGRSGIYNNYTYYADMWRSADGINWTRTAQAAPFGERWGHSMIAFNGELLVVGGFVNDGNGIFIPANDVWRSTDGITWTQVTQVTNYTVRALFKAVIFNGRLWLVGGYNHGGPWVAAVSTADGATWRTESVSLPTAERLLISVAAHDGNLWITGGGTTENSPDGNPVYSNLIWRSPDGVNWTQVNAGPRYSGRVDASMVSFDNRLWVLGGTNSSSMNNDVWVSADDGLNWRMRYVGTIPYP